MDVPVDQCSIRCFYSINSLWNDDSSSASWTKHLVIPLIYITSNMYLITCGDWRLSNLLLFTNIFSSKKLNSCTHLTCHIYILVFYTWSYNGGGMFLIEHVTSFWHWIKLRRSCFKMTRNVSNNEKFCYHRESNPGNAIRGTVL